MAVGIYTAFPDNPYVLSIFGFFFSLPCFYYIVATPEYATSGRFVLLTYNLTCLFWYGNPRSPPRLINPDLIWRSYNSRKGDIPVREIAYHRSVAVIAGVVWAAAVSRFWWPAEARRELGTALGELSSHFALLSHESSQLISRGRFCLNIGWLYTRLVASNSFDPEQDGLITTGETNVASTEHSPLLSTAASAKLKDSIEEFMSMCDFRRSD